MSNVLLDFMSFGLNDGWFGHFDYAFVLFKLFNSDDLMVDFTDLSHIINIEIISCPLWWLWELQ